MISEPPFELGGPQLAVIWFDVEEVLGADGAAGGVAITALIPVEEVLPIELIATTLI